MPPKIAMFLHRTRNPGTSHGAVLRHLVLRLLGAERLERIELILAVLAAACRQRYRAVRPSALERLDHQFLLGARRLGELGDGRRTAELDCLAPRPASTTGR